MLELYSCLDLGAGSVGWNYLPGCAPSTADAGRTSDDDPEDGA